MSETVGTLTVVYGPMFAGKTTELLRLIDRATRAKKKVLVYKPVIDDRYGSKEIKTHDGCFTTSEVKPIKFFGEIVDDVDMDVPDYVFVDEIQLFSDPPEVVRSLIEDLLGKGINVVVGGLNTDFKGDTFPIMKEIIPVADNVIRLVAICSVCGDNAVMTQRLDKDGNPVPRSAPLIQIGGSDTYEARCRKHHEVVEDEKVVSS